MEEFRDRAMKKLVRRSPWLQDVVVGVAERDSPVDRRGGGRIGPGSPRHKQRALGVWMQIPHSREKFLPR